MRINPTREKNTQTTCVCEAMEPNKNQTATVQEFANTAFDEALKPDFEAARRGWAKSKSAKAGVVIFKLWELYGQDIDLDAIIANYKIHVEQREKQRNEERTREWSEYTPREEDFYDVTPGSSILRYSK